MSSESFTNIGSKIRKERRFKGLSQSILSKNLGISPSYLNLLESGRRPITVPLLIKIGNELGISLKDLTLESNKRILSDVMDALSNEMFEDLDITNHDTADFISNTPNIARALLSLNDSYNSLRDDMQNRLEMIDVESTIQEKKSSRLPVEIVSDFLQENKNYFGSLERKSELIRKKLDLNFGQGIGEVELKFTTYLADYYDVKVKIVPSDKNQKVVKKFDNKKKILFLSEMLTYTSRNFHLAYQIAFFESQILINNIIEDNKIYSKEVIPLLNISLLNYFAAALIMPYDELLNSAKKYKYDVELLMHHFAVSFEQITHRLTNLQRPGNEGVPFHFLKTD